MAVDAETIQRLIEELAQDRQTFIENANKTHDLLQETLLSLKPLSIHQSDTPRPLQPSWLTLLPTPPPHHKENVIDEYALTKAAQRVTTADIEVESFPSGKPLSELIEETESESEGESVFVHTALQPEQYDMEGLRLHLQTHRWNDASRAILCGLDEDDSTLSQKCIFPIDENEAKSDRSHLSHYSIYDVGFDGTPLDIKHSGLRPPTRALEIWNRISSINIDSEKRPAAGRIVIVREPSPKLFAALHYTMNKHFDMDEMFDLLKDEDPALMYPHRAFDEDERHRRTFIMTMEYFTIIGDNCKPMKWQSSDEEITDELETHIPISRCSSVIALSLEGPLMARVKNRDRRISNKYGEVFDPFSPWRVLSIQAYPDWHATTDTHKPTNHYVNGPEAFLYTVEAEFEDAQKRLKDVYNHVSDLVEPPANFIFNGRVREALLFEDDEYTYSKRYFWAYQTLSIINSDITEMIESYRETFNESVWEGSNKIIWPGESSDSSRHQHWRKRMVKLRQMMDDEIGKLEYMKSLNLKKMKEIEALRENLFSGTSVMESRRSVKQTAVTIEQNRSVLLLTLVTIFFLPLTFVTSVFGMTNMNPTDPFSHFGWTVFAICVPTYLLIGSMHTDAGLQFWSHNTDVVIAAVARWLAYVLFLVKYEPDWAKAYIHPRSRNGSEEEDDPTTATGPLHKQKRRRRSNSATRMAMNARMRTTWPDEQLPSGTFSRLNSRDRDRDRGYSIPRPQPTSGDARVPVQLHQGTVARTRPRSSEVKFSVDRSSLRVHGKGASDDVDSVSPRTASPAPVDDGGGARQRTGKGWRGPVWLRGFVGWFSSRRRNDGVEVERSPQPDVSTV